MTINGPRAIALPDSKQYFDSASSELFAIAPFVDALMGQNDQKRTTEKSSAIKLFRAVLTEPALSTGASEAIAMATAQLNSYKAKHHFTILEVTATSQALVSFTQQSQGNRQKLLSLYQSADLLIIDSKSLALVVEQSPNSQSAHQDNCAIASFNQLASLLIKQDEAHSYFFFSEDLQSEFTHRTQQSTQGNSQRCTEQLPEKGVLSALTASFMLFNKRCCDAVVLAIAATNQLSRLQSQTADSIDTTLLSWPCELLDFPQFNSAINNQAASADPLHFASTDTLSLGLYPVIDTVEWLEKLLAIGINTIQLRIKDLPYEQLDKAIEKASVLGKQYNARLFINDYWELAIKHKCYGVHVGQEDLDSTDLKAIEQAGLRLGISTHSEYEWLRAISINPSYIAMGTVYPTQTKPAILIGLNNLDHWCKTLAEHFPIVAIGGIKEGNIDEVLSSGVGSIAVVTAITLAEDYKQATASLQSKQQTQRIH